MLTYIFIMEFSFTKNYYKLDFIEIHDYFSFIIINLDEYIQSTTINYFFNVPPVKFKYLAMVKQFEQVELLKFKVV